ncbi:MAG: EAL domain-containing protein [Elusimicrobia bacterium]|nr:EAL domain-containing protein [Elusimicrobiota bacterium]
MYKTPAFRNILLLIFTAVVLVSLSIVLYWKHLDNVLEQREKADIFSAGQTLAKEFNYQIDAELQVLASVGESLEGLPRVEDTKGLMLYLARQKQRNNFEMMGFQFPDGKTYFSDSSAQNDFLSAEAISAAYRDNYYVSRSAAHDDKRIIIVKPVYRNGNKAGVLFAAQLTAFYETALYREPVPGYTQWFIAGADGDIILGRNNAAAGCLKQIPPDNGAARCSLSGRDYFISSVPLEYNNWRLLALQPNPGHRPQKQLTAAVFMCVAIIIVLGVLLLFIILAYRQHSDALYRSAFIYHVTGLGNHNYFESNFARTADAFRKNKIPFALTAVNINRFKAINDIYGFEQGDKILKHAARILKEEVKENELLCHSSADRFLLLLACPDRAEFNARIEKILSRISHFCQDEKLCLEITVNAGMYLVDEDVPFYIMIDRANMALNSIRRDAGQTFAFYNDAYREQIKLISEIESKMNAALADGQFKVFIQPKYDFKTRRIESAEALVRWQDAKKGLIPPDKFIPVFEKNGFVLKLDMFVLEETVKLLARRIKEGRRVVPVGVNFSRLHLEDARFIDAVTEIVDRYNLPHNLIELEITESIAFDSGKTMRGVLDALHARGFTVAMDDFGAGYSSLNILKDLNFDCVKLDKEFLTRGETSERMRHIISGTVEMIKKLGCVIVTEGVETKEQVEFLTAIGCDLAQGYVFSRPLPSADFEHLLDEDVLKTKL